MKRNFHRPLDGNHCAGQSSDDCSPTITCRLRLTVDIIIGPAPLLTSSQTADDCDNLSLRGNAFVKIAPFVTAVPGCLHQLCRNTKIIIIIIIIITVKKSHCVGLVVESIFGFY